MLRQLCGYSGSVKPVYGGSQVTITEQLTIAGQVCDYNKEVKGLSWNSYVTILRKWLIKAVK
jgi:hypothetical protein